MLSSTFCNKSVFVCASKGAVNLADQLHVAEEGVEGVEVGEAHHVGGAASCSLQKDPKSVIPSVRYNYTSHNVLNHSMSLKRKSNDRLLCFFFLKKCNKGLFLQLTETRFSSTNGVSM